MRTKRASLISKLIITVIALGATTRVGAQYYSESDEAQAPLQQPLDYDEVSGTNGTGFVGVSESGARVPLVDLKVPPVHRVPDDSDSDAESLVRGLFEGDVGWYDRAMEDVDSKLEVESLLFVRREEESVEEYVARGLQFVGLSAGAMESYSFDPVSVYEELESVDSGDVEVNEGSLVEVYTMFLKSRIVLDRWERRREEIRGQARESGGRESSADEEELREAEEKSQLWTTLSRTYGNLVLGVNGPL
ncbi:hypothetical protein FA15DRAFT_671741 [Coprinopsis marcescibilis]|uniref:Uncharacterized protein n=1 Tax=Coprinopsis marcescibilis TaxID=230819 RepID=A0A5C3KP25_COPMA|nr:hypothetical protein FA15DRAFT_671741 [Coprinopsis marcescibilis]